MPVEKEGGAHLQEHFQSLIAKAAKAADAYYNSDQMLMTDSEYDALIGQIAELKAQHPEWDDGGLIEKVAAGVGNPVILPAWEVTSSPALPSPRVTT